MIIKNFKIVNLFGYRTINLVFNSPYKILIGENGIGKTTILNCLYYTISKKFEKLVEYRFDSIELNFEKTKVFFTHDDVYAFCESKNISSESPLLRAIETSLQQKDYSELRQIIFSNYSQEMKADKVKVVLDRRKFSIRASNEFIYKNVRQITISYVAMLFSRNLEKWNFTNEYEILYYPTYRRVETPLNGVLSKFISKIKDDPFVDVDEFVSAFQSGFIQFGMDDVKKSINSITQVLADRTRAGFGGVLSNTLSFLAEDKDYQRHVNPTRQSTIDVLLARQGEKLSTEVRTLLRNYYISGQNDKPALNYLIDILYKLYEDNSPLDNAIRTFCDICNKYLFEKSFIYDEFNMKVYLLSAKNSEQIDLEYLSSGEKQIVSLFARLCLNINKKCLVIFDEPELSLSLAWQKQLLPDIVKVTNCNFILAATHSPFIFSNEMEQYAEALNDSIE